MNNNKKPDAERVWKEFEDLLVPRLELSVVDRAVYSHLLRHSRLEGKLRLRFSIPWLARGVRLSCGPVREAVRRLVENAVLRLVERSKAGHVAEVRLPEEIRGARHDARAARAGVDRGEEAGTKASVADLEETDFLKTRALRKAIHAREGGRCFYCLRQIGGRMECLDHVVPRALAGRNSYRNLVSCCVECNSRKGEKPAGDCLRWLYREGRLTSQELALQLRALEELAAGKLRPILAGE